MMRSSPPKWMERALKLFLSARDKETISGDLLEEYRERIGRGRFAADLWYGRQVASFMSVRLISGSALKAALTSLCIFAALSGTWLLAMEFILKHPGRGVRSAMDAGIVIEALFTVICLATPRSPLLRICLLCGSGGILWLGVSALWSDLAGAHFEGFVLVISVALIAQGVLSLLLLGHADAEARAA